MTLPTAWIYVLTNQNNTTLYVGVTSDLSTRIWEHKFNQDPGSFTSRYNLKKLVYYEGFESVTTAIKQERYIKGKKRAWKNAMINSKNPDWNDLSDEVTLNQDLLTIVKTNRQPSAQTE